MAGLILVGLGYAGAGRFIRYVPVPVVEGFTLGIAAIILLQQVPAALGVGAEGEKVLGQAAGAVVTWASHPHWPSLVVAAAVVAGVLGLARLRPGLPWALVVVVLATLASSLLGLGLATIGTIPAGLPSPSVPTIPLADLDSLLLPAVAVAALAALESLLSATVSDAMSVGQRHDSDRELVGQGIANLAAPLFGGIPATAAIARTAVNVRSGAVSRLAAVTHAAVLLVIVLVASRWVGPDPDGRPRRRAHRDRRADGPGLESRVRCCAPHEAMPSCWSARRRPPSCSTSSWRCSWDSSWPASSC